jgi:ribulose-phosphate 3-epimerase
MLNNMIDVIPGIFESDPAEIRRKLDLVAGHVPWVQLDISDGTLVEKQSLVSSVELEKIIAGYPQISFEAHLMVANPEKYVRKYAEAGFKRLIAHVEATDPRLFLDEVKYESMEVGLAIDASTELDIAETMFEEVDFILVMTAEMGRSGQQLMPETVEKIRLIHENLPDIPIEADCGINEQTAKIVCDAGATRLAVTSYLFVKNPDNISRAVRILNGD